MNPDANTDGVPTIPKADRVGYRTARHSAYSATVRSWVDGASGVASTFGVGEEILSAATEFTKAAVSDDTAKQLAGVLGGTEVVRKFFDFSGAALSLGSDLQSIGSAVRGEAGSPGEKFAAGAAASSSLLKHLGTLTVVGGQGAAAIGLVGSALPFIGAGVLIGIAGAFAAQAAAKKAHRESRATAAEKRATQHAQAGGAGVRVMVGGGGSQLQQLRMNVESLAAAFRKVRSDLESTERTEVGPKSTAIRALIGGSSDPKYAAALEGIAGAIQSMRATQQRLSVSEAALRNVAQNL
ncbi:hypothetical protein C6V83_16760 [Gordonia iterans]|uniref:Uncharacterized protein n=1 Tax=Gordonia iterans TaxID=1004901 RepID=A0A2S0KJ12_9ACTN|nr:hypothetical protein [Gordonia iterans]AVM01664.1 hypothetical protein C6V83_16760 [Gordonia iterans]